VPATVPCCSSPLRSRWAVLADLLRISINTASRWVRIASGEWSNYVGGRAMESTGSCSIFMTAGAEEASPREPRFRPWHLNEVRRLMTLACFGCWHSPPARLCLCSPGKRANQLEVA
jgi:hypothetical protein